MQVTVETIASFVSIRTDMFGNEVQRKLPQATITFYIDLQNDKEAEGMTRENYHKAALAIARRRYGPVFPKSIILRNDDLELLDQNSAIAHFAG